MRKSVAKVRMSVVMAGPMKVISIRSALWSRFTKRLLQDRHGYHEQR